MKKFLITILSIVVLFTAAFTFVEAQKLGDVLIGEYNYYDLEGDLEYGSTYQWYREDIPIPGATSLQYTVTQEDIGHTLYFEVTPRSLTGISPGSPLKSQGVFISSEDETTGGNESGSLGGGVLPLPSTTTSTSTPVITYTSTSTTTSTDKGTSSSTISGLLPKNHYLSPLDGKVKPCRPFTSYLRLNSKNNDPEEVKLWQIFLNREVGAKLPITGFFGSMTFKAAKDFQLKYANEILNPWDITEATGYIYKSTIYKANRIFGCVEAPVTLSSGVVLSY